MTVLILKILLVGFIAYMAIMQPYYFTLGCFAVAIFYTIQQFENDKHKHNH